MQVEQTSHVEQDSKRPTSGHVRIAEDDSRELRWYFSEPMIAGVGSGGSLGAMLERAAIMAIALVPCRRCGGSSADDRPGSGYCPKGGGNYQKALARYWKDQAKQMGLRLVDSLETAEGWRKLGVKATYGGEIAEDLPPHMTKRCQRCEGSGMVQRRRNNRGGPQTVKATGSSVNGNPDAMSWIDEQALARYATVTRKLDRVRERSATARAALAIYYRPGGGSIGDLWVLTDEGRRFYEQTKSAQDMAPDALMANERELQRVSPTVDRTLMFSRIARESAEVWNEACAVWAEVTS